MSKCRLFKKLYLSQAGIDMDIDHSLNKRLVGAHGAGETPVPIPNTAVKPSSGYNTWPIKAWENSTVPNYS